MFSNFDFLRYFLLSMVYFLKLYNKEGAHLIQSLFDAIRNNNMTLIKKRIVGMENVNAPNKDGITALMHAASFGTPDTVKLLLASGADVNIDESDGITPLILASSYGLVDIVDLLLKAKANVHHESKDEMTALMYATIFGHRDIQELLKSYT